MTLARITSHTASGHEYKARAEVVPAVPARYSQMIDLATLAAQQYRAAATLASLPTEGLPEVKILRRIVAAWLDQISDPHIVAVAIGAGFPAHLAPMVRVKSLRGWLTAPIYEGGYEHPGFARILAKAEEKYAEAFPDLAKDCEDCGGEGDDHTGACLAEVSLDDEVATVMDNIRREDDLPESWQFATVGQIQSLAYHRARMQALAEIAAENGVTVPPTISENDGTVPTVPTINDFVKALAN